MVSLKSYIKKIPKISKFRGSGFIKKYNEKFWVFTIFWLSEFFRDFCKFGIFFCLDFKSPGFEIFLFSGFLSPEFGIFYPQDIQGNFLSPDLEFFYSRDFYPRYSGFFTLGISRAFFNRNSQKEEIYGSLEKFTI